MTKKLVLIDGNSIAYRAFFALPLLNNEKGIYTNAVYGFTTMLNKIIEEEKPTHMLVAFDAGKTTFRHESYKEYKGGRQKTPPELSEQFPMIRELLNAYDIKQYELPNYEADDIIGTLSKEAEAADYEVKVISGDKDLTQLSSEKTTVGITRKGITDIEPYTPSHIQEKYGLTADQIIDMKGLMGDSSDNIPGVPGVGEKTAIKLLAQFGTIEKIYDHLEDVSGKKLKEKLETNKELAILSKQLVTIERNAPIEVKVEDLRYIGANDEKLIPLLKELEFNTILEKMNVEVEEDTQELTNIEVTILSNFEQEHLASPSALHIEIAGENYHRQEILGVTLHNEKGTFFVGGDKAFESEAFTTWFTDDSKEKWVYDAKKTFVVGKRFGCEVKGITFDLFLASYILNPSEAAAEFAGVVSRHGFTNISSDEQVYGKGAKWTVPAEDVLADHLGRKVYGVFAVKGECTDELVKNEQMELLEELELPLALVLGAMESYGVKVDKERLNQMGTELLSRLKDIEEKIYSLAGDTFNINSPKQLGVILFEKLELPVLKKTKTGYSTSADVLEKLESEHEIVKEILHYRQLSKLQSTYVEGLTKVITDDTSRIHTRYNQALTQTGRLSSIDPNLQNIPIRLEEARKIRQAFVPSTEGWTILAADYSQIELRVLAHIADDEGLKEAFLEDRDVHTKTAMDVFGVKEEEVTSLMRRHAKAVNFGIVYGISDYGLSQSLSISRKEAGTFIEKYLNSFPGVKEYMDEIVKDAKKQGYVSTLLHRRRYLPDITSRNFNLKSFAERTAMNTPIQGSAADIIKKAMIDMQNELDEQGLTSKMLLQVHDELVFEVPEEELELMKELVPTVMERAAELSVPLKADVSFGPSWYEAK
ncbi:DNA polymerase I [Mangrovibacillus cuniculi]|uniref:DNA polymerase I n=1 Tax=Mangrovibacillus cuniculi TaxID=2593652 RepID=A0A7S8HG43_9BACI|nr:DNA polymerase I [Mangrovibacillus cuniculi]QPC47196.1 DNA polymerase I [Mangrovibacillus cuniculi]